MNHLVDFSFFVRGRYGILIIDNEVTVGDFITEPPLLWSRLTQSKGNYQIAEGYPTPLTLNQAQLEMKTWDTVSLPAILQSTKSLVKHFDHVAIGNNAGQGLPIAEGIPEIFRETGVSIVYGNSLPQKKDYESMGYKIFIPRKNLANFLIDIANTTSRPPILAFINTIQHNASNYHDP